MGTGDRTDPTTDFYDTHRAQCVAYANLLRFVPQAATVVARMDEAIALCDTALAGGRHRAAMSSSLTKMQEILSSYAALSPQVRANFDAALAAAEAVPVGIVRG